MYRKGLLICCLWGLVGCGEQRPQGILSEQKMRDVWVDLNLAKSSLSHRSSLPSAAAQAERTAALYAYVFKKNGISQGDFEKSNRYYTEHPQRYVKIMKVVLDSIKGLKKEMDQRIQAQKRYSKAQKGFRENGLLCLFCEPARLRKGPG